MKDQEEFVDRLLDRSLARLGESGPEPGLETRIVARLRAESAAPRVWARSRQFGFSLAAVIVLSASAAVFVFYPAKDRGLAPQVRATHSHVARTSAVVVRGSSAPCSATSGLRRCGSSTSFSGEAIEKPQGRTAGPALQERADRAAAAHCHQTDRHQAGAAHCATLERTRSAVRSIGPRFVIGDTANRLMEGFKMQRLKLTVLLLALALVAAPGISRAAQNSGGQARVEKPLPPAPVVYNVHYVIYELANGKRINSRSYTLMASGPENRGSVRVGSSVPFSGGGYKDVGMSIDCNLPAVAAPAGQAVLDTRVNWNFLPGTDNATHQPIFSQLAFSGPALVPLGKPTIIGTMDDTTSDHQFQIEVTVKKVE